MARMWRDDIEDLARRALESAGTTPRAPRRPKGRFNTARPVLVYPNSGTGAWEATLSNTL